MLQSFRIAFAFIGAIVGAGFASGKEIFQYFTSFGLYGSLGAVLSTISFAYLGMILTKVGSRLQVKTHEKAIYQLSGKYAGRFIDYVIILTLFGVGVVMIAGAGTMLYKLYNYPQWVGALMMAILTVLTIILPIQRVITIISAITPFLIIALLIIASYSLFTEHPSFEVLDQQAKSIKNKSLPNWFVSAINYVSFNIGMGVSIALVMGGNEKNEKIASLGGFLGGLGVGILILIAHFSIFFQIETVKDDEFPLLHIIQNISPVLGMIMSIVLLGMIYNSSVAMFYAFVVRFTSDKTRKYRYVFAVVTVFIGFIVSFFGFEFLITYFYPLIGYLGLLLIVILLIAPFKIRGIK